MSLSFERSISQLCGSSSGQKFARYLAELASVGPGTARRYGYVVRELLGRDQIFSYEQACRFVKKKNRVYVRAAVVKFLEFLEHLGEITDDELAIYIKKLPKVREAPPKSVEVPTIQEIRDVMNAMEKEDRRIALFMFYTGARVHEAMGVKLRDVDFSTGRVILYGKGRLEKKSRPAKLPMDYAAELQREAKALGLLEAEFIFWPNSKASVTSRSIMFDRKLNEACIKVTGKRFGGSHNFRRAVASKLLEETDNIVFVQDILGHENINTTRKYAKYVNREKQLDQAREILGNIVAK